METLNRFAPAEELVNLKVNQLTLSNLRNGAEEESRKPHSLRGLWDIIKTNMNNGNYKEGRKKKGQKTI